MTADNIIWEDPPPPALNAHWAVAFVNELKKHPGKWARVVGGGGRVNFAGSTSIRLKKLGCEIRTTTLGAKKGQAFMWARWPESTEFITDEYLLNLIKSPDGVA